LARCLRELAIDGTEELVEGGDDTFVASVDTDDVRVER
jgi:hypothetical protein